MKLLKTTRKRYYIIIMLLVILIGYGNHQIIKSMEPSMQALAKHKVSNALNNIVKEILNDLKIEEDKLYTIKRNLQGDISDVNFNTKELNKLLLQSLNTVDDSLEAAIDGKKDPITKEVFYEDGIIYKVPLGYFTKIFFLYDKGPKLNIWMRMLNDVNGDIKCELQPYGQNAALLKIVLVVEMKAEAITHFSRNEINNTCEIPLVIQIIHGEVNNFSSNVANIGRN